MVTILPVPFTLHVLMEVQSSLIMDSSLDIRVSSCFVLVFFLFDTFSTVLKNAW